MRQKKIKELHIEVGTLSAARYCIRLLRVNVHYSCHKYLVHNILSQLYTQSPFHSVSHELSRHLRSVLFVSKVSGVDRTACTWSRRANTPTVRYFR